jgi:cytochrome P450
MIEGIGKVIEANTIFQESFRTDPYPIYQYFQANFPVFWDKNLQAWIVTRSADISTVLHSPDEFLSNRVEIGRRRFPDSEFVGLFDMIARLMLQSDGESHGRWRHLVAQSFKRHAIEAYAPRVRCLVDEILDHYTGSGVMEFVEDIASPLPVLIISEILGIPASDRAQIKRWCDSFSIVALNFYSTISEAQLRAGSDAVKSFSDHLRDLLQDCRGRAGGSGLLSVLVNAEDKGDQLDFDDVVANTILLLNAGNETTTVLLSNAAHVLCTRPDIQASLRRDHSRIPALIEETLRCFPPVQFIGRLVAQDSTLGGKAIGKGDLVIVFLGAAGRDGSVIDAPQDFRIDRPKSPHLSFGAGPHVCLGLQLARLECQILIEAMLARYSSLQLTSVALEFGPNLNLRSYARLPIEFST